MLPTTHLPLRPARAAASLAWLWLLLGSASALAAPAGAGRAQQARHQLHARFAGADKDGNGQLTRDEARAGMPHVYRAFDQIDATHKGYVTEADIAAHAMSQAARGGAHGGGGAAP